MFVLSPDNVMKPCQNLPSRTAGATWGGGVEYRGLNKSRVLASCVV